MRAGSLYFILVFSVGFLLGTVRTLAVEPLLGVRTAGLLELPLMLAASLLAARWVVRRMAVPERSGPRIVMGAVGLLLMLAAEFGFVLWLRGVSLAEYFAGRDPVASNAYYIALGIFAAMPLIMLSKNRKRGL